MRDIRKLVVLCVVLTAVVLVVGGCTTPTPETIEKEVTREVPVEVTREVVVEKEVTVEVEKEVPVEVTREVEVEVTREVEVEVTREVEVEVPVEGEPGVEAPFEALWAGSGHADAEAEAFRHWDEDDPVEVSTSCAKCHSSYGYLDFLGADGTEAGVVDNAAAVDSVIDCTTCHNEAAASLTSVVMPSGVELTGLGAEARCMQCHQGRQSTVSVNDHVAAAGVADDDTVSEDLAFRNVHYFAAGATLYGGQAMGGYQYDGKTYDARFAHVEGIDTCIDCHDPHTLEVRVEMCSACHVDVSSKEDLADIRLLGSGVDFDGDGEVSEGIAVEIEHLQEVLYEAIQAYASDAGTPVVYDSHAYPYFFIDTNANSEADADEANYGNRYNAWTGRLLKAAYNYQYSKKDPGAFAHGGKYVIQLLYDSIEDLDAGLVAGLHRDDAGHFAGSTEAWRHWDEDGEVRSSCARCHSATGLPFYLETGVNVAEPLANGMLCSTCHDPETYAPYAVDEVEFPSGATASFGEGATSNLCLNCHQGRQSTVSVNSRIGDNEDDAVVEGLGFANVHYFAAGATMFGGEVMGGYQYDGKTYDVKFAHVEGIDACVDCHDAHTLEVKVEVCSACHAGVSSAEDLADIRLLGSIADYDGDGEATEGIAHEIEHLTEVLYGAIQAYAADVAGTPIVYNSHRYPYWFTDAEERYGTWTPRLLRAAYNYQYAKKDPGAFAHGGKYLIQLLYDSIEDLDAGLVADMHRDDPGHFAGSTEAWRHWDEDGEVSASCAKCHSATGLPTYLATGENVAEPLANGMLCTTCHDDPVAYTRYAVDEVEFPSGAVAGFGEGVDSNLCLNCHQGRQSTVSVDEHITAAGVGDDEVSGDLGFRNVHYFAAGATVFGAEAMGAYQYEGKEYVGAFAHVPGFDTCTQCHDTHNLEVKVEACGTCHPGKESVEDIRMSTTDFDGDGHADEGIAHEIDHLQETLYGAIQAYASEVTTPIIYDSHSYPYFFVDTDGNGEVDAGEANYGNRYRAWTPRLLRAAYNYQYAAKDPGGFAHNGKYVIQALYDSLDDIGADTAGMVRP